jgi:nucleoside-diphosphate-sugar epimerase
LIFPIARATSIGMNKTLLSFGHGYSAQALTRILLPLGWRIIGTTRTTEKQIALQATGVEAVVWPGTDLSVALAQHPHVLISAGPGPDGDPVLAEMSEQFSQAAPHLPWLGYLSTTGVYGDHQGAWVDETTPLTPSTKRGQARVLAESAWQSIPQLPLHIFRLAGIYGPGRGPFAKVRAGTARRIIKKGQVFSRIHVEDIATALELSIKAPDPGAIYNLCDDDPAPPQDVIGHAAELLGLPMPPTLDFETAEMTPMARSFYAESKKVSNARAKTDLGWTPMYPTYRVGLADLLARAD